MAHLTVSELSVTFGAFFEEWLLEKQCLLQHLLRNSTMENKESDTDMVDTILNHYRKYYNEKAKLADENVFMLFSPPWLSSYECTLLWVTGFKPSLIFRIVKVSAGELSAEQACRMERVKVETTKGEREVEEAMERIEERVSELGVLGLMMRPMTNGEDQSELESTMETFEAATVAVAAKADELRACTVKSVLEILSTIQSINFFTACMQFELGTRKYGLQRDSPRANE